MKLARFFRYVIFILVIAVTPARAKERTPLVTFGGLVQIELPTGVVAPSILDLVTVGVCFTRTIIIAGYDYRSGAVSTTNTAYTETYMGDEQVLSRISFIDIPNRVLLSFKRGPDDVFRLVGRVPVTMKPIKGL